MNRYNMELDRITVPESAVDSLMERANAPRKKAGWLRPMAVAACLALMIALPTVAAVKPFVVRYHESGEVEAENRDYIPVEAFSAELRAKVEELGTDSELEACRISFDNWDVAEDFIGINILDNPVLDGKEMKYRYDDGKAIPYQYTHLNLAIAPWGLTGMDLDCVYRLDKVHVRLNAFLHTEEGGGTIGFHTDNPRENLYAPEYGVTESRVSTAGREYTVQFGQFSDGPHCAQAWLNCNGATVWLYFSSYSQAALQSAVQQVMDGFQ